MATNVIDISSAEELRTALREAEGGETLALAEGDYGSLAAWDGSDLEMSYSSPVTITSADGDAPATFESVQLLNARNVTFDGLTFDYTFEQGDERGDGLMRLENSQAIDVLNSRFIGDEAEGVSEAADGFGFGQGLEVLSSSDVHVEGNEFTDWFRALGVARSESVQLDGNDVHAIRSDGLIALESRNVEIVDNHFHDFETSEASSDHPDMIQFWTANTDAPTEHVTIRGNTFDAGDGDSTQSIWMRNELVDTGRAGEELYYRDIVVADNVISNGHANGLYVGEGEDIRVESNILLKDDIAGTTSRYPRIEVADAADDVTIQDNSATTINGFEGQNGWSVSGNIEIQAGNEDEPGFYEDQFLSSSYTFGGPAGDFVVTPDSLVGKANAAPEQMFLDRTPSELTPAFDVKADPGGTTAYVFDGSFTFGPDGRVDPSAADYRWDFDDGGNASGMRVQHTFESAGYYDVTLDIVDGGDVVGSADATVGFVGRDVLTFDPEEGRFYSSAYGERTAVGSGNVSRTQTDDGRAMELGVEGRSANIDRHDISGFFGTNDFDLSVTFRADPNGNQEGEIFRVTRSIVGRVDENGDVHVGVTNSENDRARLETQLANANDGQVHEVEVHFNGVEGQAELLLDGEIAAAAPLSGSIRQMAHQDLVFGSRHGAALDGELRAFDLDATNAPYDAFAGSMDDVAGDAEAGTPSAGEDSEQTGGGEGDDQDGAGGTDQNSDGDDTHDSDGGGDQAPDGGDGQDADDGNEGASDDTGSPPDGGGSGDESEPGGDSGSGGDGSGGDDDSSDGDESDSGGGDSDGSAPGSGPGSDVGQGDGEQAPDEPDQSDHALEADFALDLASLEESDETALLNGAEVVKEDGENRIRLEGGTEAVDVGSRDAAAGSDALTFTAGFARAGGDRSSDVLLSRDGDLAVLLHGDGLSVRAARETGPFKDFCADDLGLSDGESHDVTVQIDEAADRLQVIADDTIAVDERAEDLDVAGNGGGAHWMLGAETANSFDGTISDFAIADDADFADADAPVDDAAHSLA